MFLRNLPKFLSQLNIQFYMLIQIFFNTLFQEKEL